MASLSPEQDGRLDIQGDGLRQSKLLPYRGPTINYARSGVIILVFSSALHENGFSIIFNRMLRVETNLSI